MKYRLEVKFSGWLTREVEADSLEEACDKAAEIPGDLLVEDLRWKQAEVEVQED